MQRPAHKRFLPLAHLLFWCAVGCLWFYLRYQDYASRQQGAVVTAIKVLDLAAVIYTVNGLLVPRLLYRKKYAAFAASFVGLVALFSFLKMLAVKAVLHQPLEAEGIKQAVYNNFVTQFFLVLAAIALKSAFDYLRLQNRLAEVAREKAEAELNFLKAQINPHFLFNSLNAVYFLIDKKNAAAREALHKFSEMLRYQLYDCNVGRIPIEKEIGFLKDYVGLQQLRLNGNTRVAFACGDDVAQFSIEPLLLMPFVENSFKHVSHFDAAPNEVRIHLQRQNGSLLFCVRNTTEGAHANKSNSDSGGIGLANVQKRLRLLYPGRHELHVAEAGGWFGVELKIPINP